MFTFLHIIYHTNRDLCPSTIIKPQTILKHIVHIQTSVTMFNMVVNLGVLRELFLDLIKPYL